MFIIYCIYRAIYTIAMLVITRGWFIHWLITMVLASKMAMNRG
jgi:hypothetical protein